jgi:hypothetical protein
VSCSDWAGRSRGFEDSGHPRKAAIDEIAIQRELTDEGIDLAERGWRRRAPGEILLEKPVGRHTEVEGRLGRILDDDGALTLLLTLDLTSDL